MTLLIQTYQLGIMNNNTYLLGDSISKKAVLIDPSFNGSSLLAGIQGAGWQLEQIWHTHAHFDHFIGTPDICKSFTPHLIVGLHPDDLNLWKDGGEAKSIGLDFDNSILPDLLYTDKQILSIGNENIEVLHTPGHCAGHVVFYSQSSKSIFCGDLIFYHSVGRTDLPGGSYQQLADSIYQQIFVLPEETILYPGHGCETSIAEEKKNNPFL